MPTTESSGTQAATIGTEHTLATITTAKVLVLEVNTRNMVEGTTPDLLELRVYVKVLTGDANSWLAYSASYVGDQGDSAAPGSSALGEIIKVSIPIPSMFSAAFTLKQTQGTGRSYDWSVISI
jgi:hypothetical protein